MKKSYTFKFLVGALLISFSFSAVAQTIIKFEPSKLKPHDDGYYLTGVEVDENNDGTMELHKGCEDYYEDSQKPIINHEETGIQQDFKYFNVMIMPDCQTKDVADPQIVRDGFIQISPLMYTGTDSAIVCEIQTPAIQNMVSLYLETSSDVTISGNRTLPYDILYSKDNGVTWEDTKIRDLVAGKSGYAVTYNTDNSLPFDEMIKASKEGPIILSIKTDDITADPKGWFVNVHYIEIEAEIYSSTSNIKAKEQFDVTVIENTISSKDDISVFSITGQSIGKGKTVSVNAPGIYIVRNNYGVSKKILIP